MQRRLGIGAALAGAASTTPVVDGRAAPHPDDGLEWKVCAATGRIDLVAIFPVSGGAERVDVSMLLGLPNLAGPIARAFRAYASGLRQASRRLVASRLRIFAAYVRSAGMAEADLDALATDVFFAELVAWLDAPRPAKVSNARTGRQAGDVAPLCLKERIAMLGLVRSLAEALLEDPDHSLSARRLLAAIPRNQWPGAARKFTPKQRIAQDDWSNIVAAAEREAVQVMRGWAEGMRLLEVGRARLLAAPGSPDYADLATCMARLDQLYPGVIPAADRIEQDDRRLRRFVQYVHRQKPTCERLYPSPRSLVPWVILFAAETALNASAVMGLDRSDVRRGEVLGRPVIWITGEKRRAARDPLLPFDASEPDGVRKKVTLATIVDFLISYTERLRGEAAPEQRDRLFLVAMTQGSTPRHAVRAFHGPDHTVADSSLTTTRSPRRYCRLATLCLQAPGWRVGRRCWPILRRCSPRSTRRLWGRPPLTTCTCRRCEPSMDAQTSTAATVPLPLHERRDDGLAREAVSDRSAWDDPAWVLQDLTPGSPRLVLNWAVPLGDGSLLTDQRHKRTLDWARRLVWSLVHAPGDGARALKPGSMTIVMSGLRTLLPWMLGQGLRLPSDLDAPALRDYLADLPGLISEGLGVDTSSEDGDDDEDVVGAAAAYFRVRVVLQVWQQRRALARAKIAPMPDIPWSGRSAIALARELATKVAGRILPIPDEVAIPLLNAAARFVGLPAEDVIRLQGASRAAYEGHRGRWGDGAARGTRKIAARTVVECFAFGTVSGEDAPWHMPITLESNRGRLGNGSLQTLRYLVEAIREAAWIVVQATTGMRISEICALEAGMDAATGMPGCVEVRPSATGLHELFLVRSRLSKTEASPRPVTWLLGMRSRGSAEVPLPVRAIAVLDRLLAPYREMTGSRSLLLGFAGPLGLPRRPSAVSEPLSANLRHSLKAFVSRWVDLFSLPDTSARSPVPGDLVHWRETRGRCISPHRWRSTLAHFVFSTDSRLLPALAMQFHHVSLAMTEEGYLGLNREMAETLDGVRMQETARYLYELASGRPLAGRMGDHLVGQADALRAAIAEQPPTAAWMRLVRLVEESGLRLWFAPHANCLPLVARDMRCHQVAGTWPGFAREPNRVAQEPSVCAGCQCAVMDERHLPFWKVRFSRNLIAWKKAERAGQATEFAVVRARTVQSMAILARFGMDVPALEAALDVGNAT